jgi:regulator of PEP synthase PpsR (kinase-PPPase family)
MKGTELEKKCQEVFAKAILSTPNVPKDWKGEWLPTTVYNELKKQIKIWAKIILKNEGWDNIRSINVIIPVQNTELLQTQIKNIEKILNSESKRKIHNTKQLNHLTGFEREVAVDELIDVDTQIDYLQLLK